MGDLRSPMESLGNICRDVRGYLNWVLMKPRDSSLASGCRNSLKKRLLIFEEILTRANVGIFLVYDVNEEDPLSMLRSILYRNA